VPVRGNRSKEKTVYGWGKETEERKEGMPYNGMGRLKHKGVGVGSVCQPKGLTSQVIRQIASPTPEA
jgi:hypothetical protein